MGSDHSFVPCQYCEEDTEPDSLYTICKDGLFFSVCMKCLAVYKPQEVFAKMIEEGVSSVIPASSQVVSNRYLTCPVCSGSYVETDFVVLIYDDETVPYGSDGIVICKGCFRSKFEGTYLKNPDKTLDKIASKNLTVAEIVTTKQVESLSKFHDIIDSKVPRVETEGFDCVICKSHFSSREMAYVIPYECDATLGVYTPKSESKVCVDCYKKLWIVAAQRVPSNIYKTVMEAMVEL